MIRMIRQMIYNNNNCLLRCGSYQFDSISRSLSQHRIWSSIIQNWSIRGGVANEHHEIKIINLPFIPIDLGLCILTMYRI